MFNDQLRKLREAHNLTQRNFADKINVSNGAIAMWETGKREPGLDILIRISDYFNVSLDYLLGRDFDKKKEAPTMPELRKDEEYLLSHYNELTQDQKEMILQSVTLFCNSNHNNRQNNDIRDLFV